MKYSTQKSNSVYSSHQKTETCLSTAERTELPATENKYYSITIMMMRIVRHLVGMFWQPSRLLVEARGTGIRYPVFLL